MGDDGGHIFGLADLEMETKPEDVLAEIDRLHRCALRDEKPAR